MKNAYDIDQFIVGVPQIGDAVMAIQNKAHFSLFNLPKFCADVWMPSVPVPFRIYHLPLTLLPPDYPERCSDRFLQVNPELRQSTLIPP